MRIAYSVETQEDFMTPGRPMYAPGVEVIRPNLKKLRDYALEKKITQAGGLDVHFGTKEYAFRELELQVNGGPFPMHCPAGKEGAERIPETYVPSITHPHYLDERVDRDLLRKGLEQGAIWFEKQQYDIFTNPAIDVFMREYGVKEAIVSGVLTDWCVKDAVLGMQKRGVQCYLVTDAIYALNLEPDSGKKALEEMATAGAKFVTTQDVLDNKLRENSK